MFMEIDADFAAIVEHAIRVITIGRSFIHNAKSPTESAIPFESATLNHYSCGSLCSIWIRFAASSPRPKQLPKTWSRALPPLPRKRSCYVAPQIETAIIRVRPPDPRWLRSLMTFSTTS